MSPSAAAASSRGQHRTQFSFSSTADSTDLAAAVNPASDGSIESQILAEINTVRRNPAAYAAKLEAQVQYYDGTVFRAPGTAAMQTVEGKAALEEAVHALKTAPAVGPMSREKGMDSSASDHRKDLASTGSITHTGSDGSKASDRISRYGQFITVAGELISYGVKTPEGIVRQILTCDGEKTRQYRSTILGDHFKSIGIAIGEHPKTGTVTVLDIAGGFGPKALTTALVAVSENGLEPADFKHILSSTPVPQITDEVKKAVKSGKKVELDYKPGEIKATIYEGTQANVLSCSWA